MNEDTFFTKRNARTFWNGLTLEEWSEIAFVKMNEFLRGKSTIQIPTNAYFIKYGEKTRYMTFIEVQMSSVLDEEPFVFVRNCHYGPALKVLVPNNIKPGDEIRIVRKSLSGKSYIAEIVTPSTKKDAT